MASNFVQVIPDSTGKKIQTFENSVGSDTVETQAVALVGTDAAPFSPSNPIPTGVVIGALAGAVTVNSTAFESGRVLKASAGTLISFTGHNNSGSDQYIMIFNSTTVPSNGATPVTFFSLPAGSSDFSFDLPITGMPFTAGISVSNSTTIPTKTAGGNNIWFCAVIV